MAIAREAYAAHQRTASSCPISDVYDLAQERIAHRSVVQSVHGTRPWTLGRVPRDDTTATCRQFGEADLEALDESAVEAEFDGAGTGE